MNSIIVDLIKKARLEKGLTQKDLADHLGKTAAAISDLERGKVQVSASDLFSLSEIINKPIEYFYGVSIDGGEETSIIISFLRRMNLKEKKFLIEYLTGVDNMMEVVAEIERTNPKVEDEQKRLLGEFYDRVVPYFSTLNKMRNSTLEVKEKLENALGISKN